MQTVCTLFLYSVYCYASISSNRMPLIIDHLQTSRKLVTLETRIQSIWLYRRVQILISEWKLYKLSNFSDLFFRLKKKRKLKVHYIKYYSIFSFIFMIYERKIWRRKNKYFSHWKIRIYNTILYYYYKYQIRKSNIKHTFTKNLN